MSNTVKASDIKTGDVVVHPKDHIAYAVQKYVDGTIVLSPADRHYGASYTYQIPEAFDLVGYTSLRLTTVDYIAYAKECAKEESISLLKRLEDKALNSDNGMLHIDFIHKEIARIQAEEEV